MVRPNPISPVVFICTLLALAAPTLAQDQRPPDWQVEGLKAAVSDPHPGILRVAITIPQFESLVGTLDATATKVLAGTC